MANTSYIANNGMKNAGFFLGSALGSILPGVVNTAVNKTQQSAASNGGGSGGRDIGTEIDNAINSGKGYQYVQDLLNQRNDKIFGSNGALNQYYGDSVSQRAQDYINNGWLNEQNQKMQDDRDRIAAEQEAAKRAEVERAVGGLAGQKDGINQSYSDLFRQLYVDKMNAQKNLPEQMATMGYTGGLSESALMDLENGYANSLRQGEQGRLSSLSDIDRAITDTRLQGDISIAEQAAQLAQQGLLSYQDLLNNQRNQANLDRDFYANEKYRLDQAEQARRDQALSQGQETKTAAQNEVDNILSLGGTPPAGLIAQSGYSAEYIAAMRGKYGQQNASRVYTDAASTPQQGTLKPSGFGGTARYLYEQITSGRMNPGALADAIERYTGNGSMTEQEASYLSGLFGVR